MLDHPLNEALNRVGPGTPMGETMRRYWLPALLAEDVYPKGENWREALLERMYPEGVPN